jgi:hypothetical protein
VDEIEEFRATMLARQAEAEEAFVTRADPGPRMKLWSRRDPVTLFGAIGMSEAGWDKLSEIFPWVAARFSNVSDFRFDDEVVQVNGDMAYTLGFERFNGSIACRPVVPAAVGMEQFFEQFAADVAGEASVAETFATLAEAGGMRVVRPRLVQSDPLV